MLKLHSIKFFIQNLFTKTFYTERFTRVTTFLSTFKYLDFIINNSIKISKNAFLSTTIRNLQCRNSVQTSLNCK